MVKYYLYHIKGVKWGMTKRTVKRRVWEQGYTLNDVCEIIEISDIDTASDLEQQLNIRDGYKNQIHSYKKYIHLYKKLHTYSPLSKKGHKKSQTHCENISLSKKGKKINWNPLTQNNWKPRVMIGSKNPNSTLTESQVIEIRNNYKTGSYQSMASYQKLCYPNIAIHIIRQILTYKSWKHI